MSWTGLAQSSETRISGYISVISQLSQLSNPQVYLSISQYISVYLSYSLSRRWGAGLAECVAGLVRQAGPGSGPQH